MGEINTFDEENAVSFIRNYVGKDISEKYSDDEILYVTDIIWDYYEKNGMLTLDAGITEDESLDVDKLISYVKKEIKNDKEIMMDPQDLESIVKGELAYEESIEDIF